jgi:hypothetical protein
MLSIHYRSKQKASFHRFYSYTTHDLNSRSHLHWLVTFVAHHFSWKCNSQVTNIWFLEDSGRLTYCAVSTGKESSGLLRRLDPGMELLSFEKSISVYQSTWCKTTVFCSAVVRTPNGADIFLFPTLEYTRMASRNITVALCITYIHPSLLFMLDFPAEHFKEVERHRTHYLRTAVVRFF